MYKVSGKINSHTTDCIYCQAFISLDLRFEILDDRRETFCQGSVESRQVEQFEIYSKDESGELN